MKLYISINKGGKIPPLSNANDPAGGSIARCSANIVIISYKTNKEAERLFAQLKCPSQRLDRELFRKYSDNFLQTNILWQK